MNTTRYSSRTWIIVALSVMVVLAVAGALTWFAARGRPGSAVQTTLIPLECTYAGTVKLDWVSPGVYSDTLTEPAGTPPDLGRIDLGFLLHRSQDSLSGYVDLGATLVFTTEHVINTTQAITTPLAVGPEVSGTFTGDNWQLESERVSMETEAGQGLIRQFRLTAVKTGPTTYAGEYRETLWGYGPQPYTVVGEFDLSFVSGKNLTITNTLYLPVIQRK